MAVWASGGTVSQSGSRIGGRGLTLEILRNHCTNCSVRERVPRQARFVLEVAKASLVYVPRVVAVAVIPLEQALGRGTDLLGLLQLAGRDPFPELLQRLSGPLHRPLTHGLLIAATLIRIDDDDPHTLDRRRNFLGSGAGRIGLLPRRDPHWAIDPLGLIDGLQPAAQLPVPPPLETDQITMTTS